MLNDLARQAGLAPERALLAFAPILRIDPEVAERVVREPVQVLIAVVP
ncbi:MAG: hypothetical protein M3550_07140 [Actinomycetota bacterium]|nr:hypothetical protein [Actinomycetota bacterium]